MQDSSTPPSLRSSSIFSSLASPQGLALGTLLCSAAPLWSQNATPAANSQADLPEVVVEANKEAPNYKVETVSSPRLTQPLREIPQTITVIPKEVIQERGATSLRDVLRNVPGISMQAGEGGGGPAGDNLSIRGFAARSDIFVDGIRDTAGGGYSRDPFNIEQVEVSKGPASTNSGRGSTGGSINLSTKTPSLDPFYRGDIGGGTDSYFRSTLDINVPLWVNGGIVPPAPSGKEVVTGKNAAPAMTSTPQSGAAFRLNALYHDQDLPGRDHVNNQRWGIAPSFAFGLGTPTRFTLSYMHLDQDNVPDYGIPWVARTSTNPLLRPGVPPVSFDSFYGSLTRDHEFIKTDILTGTFEHDFSETLKLRSAVRWGRNDRDSITTAPRFVNVNTSSAINRQFQSRDQLDETLGMNTDLRWDFTTGDVKHQLVTGVEIARDDSRNDARVSSAGGNPATDLFNPNPWDPFTGTISYSGAFTETAADTLAFYLFDTVELSKKWIVTGGLRWDSVDVDYTTRAAAPALTLTELTRDDSMLSFKAAVTYKPVENGNIYLGYGTSFNPSTENLTYIAAPTGTNNTLSLFQADPEETRTLELGTKWDLFDEKLALTAAIFRTEKTNARTVDPADPTVVSLTGEQVVQGFELGFSGAVTDKWRLIGGYTYLDSEVEKSAVAAEVGNEVSNTPEHSFSLWTVHDIGSKVQVGAGVQYVGARFNNSNEDTRQRAESFVTVDAMVNYQVNDNISLRLNGYNLFDEEYIDRLGGGHFIPGAGRSVALTASFNF
jgi:catecholate siderophore receptor